MKIGFCGAGNMAGAIIKGIINKGLMKGEDIIFYDVSSERREILKKEYGLLPADGNPEVAKKADYLFLCVKPQVLEGLLKQIRKDLRPDTIVISIAAGKTLAFLEEQLGKEHKIVRVMPNTPALIGEGISAVSLNEEMKADEANTKEIMKLLSSLGSAELVEEKMIDIIGQLAGASPAWIAMVIEAMADGAVYAGMSREMAYRFASAGVAGAGKLAAALKGNPSLIKDMCSSPKGTTIEGIRVLEERGVRGAFMDALIAAVDKSEKL